MSSTASCAIGRSCEDLARRSYAGLWAHPVGMLILTVGTALGDSIPVWMWTGTACAAAITVLRWIAANRVLASPPRLSPDGFCRLATVTMLTLMLGWGVLGMLTIRWFGPSHPATNLLYITLAGITSGGVMATAPRRQLMLAYISIPWLLGIAADLSVPHRAWPECTVKCLFYGFLVVQGRRMAAAYEDGVARERDLEEARRAAEASSAAKDRFLANMSHEIRTPMNGVLGTLALLARTRLDREQRDLVSLARESAGGLLGLLNDILDLAKVEAGHMSMEMVEFDLQALCSGAVGMFKGSASAKGLGLDLRWSGTPGEQVAGDPTRLRQVLANLIGNAVKFTERGQVRLAVERRGDLVRFAVTDTGIGIAADKLQDIFAAFVQADAGTTRLHGGTGLGLAISREIVQLMGGEITVESQPGQGSSFSFEVSLPRTRPAEAPAADPPPKPAPAAESPSLRVLLVEDGVVNQRVVQGMLGLLGHRADIVTNGAHALEAVQQVPYDLILMDIQMPVMNGLEATAAIRALEAANGTARRAAIHGLSANAYESDRERGLQAGMDGYLTKPLALDQLRDVLASLQKEKPPAAGLPAEGGSSNPNLAVLHPE